MDSLTRIPSDVLKEIDMFRKATKLKSRPLAFQMASATQGEVINEFTQRLPRSKNQIKIIDVRYKFKI